MSSVLLTVIGLMGTGLYISAYGLLQARRVKADDLLYNAMNASASILLMISLLDAFHLASFVSNLLWLALTLKGWLLRKPGWIHRLPIGGLTRLARVSTEESARSLSFRGRCR